MPFAVQSQPLGPLLAYDLDTAVGVAASEMSVLLFDELARGPRSGIHWADLPYRSSAPGEPEQEQSGELRGSVGTQPEPNQAGLVHAFSFGFYGVPEEKLYRLELDDSDPAYRGTLERIATDGSAQAFALTQAVLALE